MGGPKFRMNAPGVTILLSLTVFLNMVAETMPATSDAVPLLGEYICRQGDAIFIVLEV